jgi:2-oxoglutarate ferredoxin oxidoreductase subunit delta
MRIKIDPDYCKGCELCIVRCPVGVYEPGDVPSSKGYFVPLVVHPEKCLDGQRKSDEKKRCEMCILVCPDQAIGWENE